MRSLQNVTLFSQTKRTDPSHGRYGEDSFSFLDRVDQKFWARVRAEMERWFAEYPSDDAKDLRGRFRDKNPGRHFAAWWELYLFHLLRQLQLDVEVHPELPDVSARPDFRVTGPGGSFLLEAATTFSGIVDEGRCAPREGWILGAIEEVKAPNFFVAIQFEHVGMKRPSVREVAEPIEAWLSGLDPDAIDLSLGDSPKRIFEPRDWRFELTALPVKPESRGKPCHRVLGIGPMTTGFTNDVRKLKGTLERKRGKYGVPDEPLVLAVLLMSPAVDNEDIEEALLGRISWRFDPEEPGSGEWVRQRNGFWMKGSEAQAMQISAVITGTGLMPWSAAKLWPRLWPNPWATHPLEACLSLPMAIAGEQGTVSYEEREGSPAEVFGLPDDWPGPESPFERGTDNQ